MSVWRMEASDDRFQQNIQHLILEWGQCLFKNRGLCDLGVNMPGKWTFWPLKTPLIYILAEHCRLTGRYFEPWFDCIFMYLPKKFEKILKGNSASCLFKS